MVIWSSPRSMRVPIARFLAAWLYPLGGSLVKIHLTHDKTEPTFLVLKWAHRREVILDHPRVTLPPAIDGLNTDAVKPGHTGDTGSCIDLSQNLDDLLF